MLTCCGLADKSPLWTTRYRIQIFAILMQNIIQWISILQRNIQWSDEDKGNSTRKEELTRSRACWSVSSSVVLQIYLEQSILRKSINRKRGSKEIMDNTDVTYHSRYTIIKLTWSTGRYISCQVVGDTIANHITAGRRYSPCDLQAIGRSHGSKVIRIGIFLTES